MNSLCKLNKILVAVCGPILLGLMLWQTLPVFAADVSGLISVDTTWTVINSPYVITNDVTIQPGVTLTIEPGVEVRGRSDTRLWVRGNLIAVGTAGKPILFTSEANTSAGGWRGVLISGGTADLQHVTVRYGGQSASRAIYVSSVAPGGQVVLDTVAIQENANAAMEVSAPFMHQVSFNNVVLTNNAINRVFIGTTYGSFAEDVTLTPQTGLEGFQLTGDNVEISGTVTLTLSAGTTLMMSDNDFLWVRNNGRLVSEGSATSPVTITSASNTAAGQWRGINVSGAMSGGTASLQHTIVRYGGQNASRAINVSRVYTDGVVLLNNVTICDNANAAMEIYAPHLHQVSFNNVTFTNNVPNRVYIDTYFGSGSIVADVNLTPQPGLGRYQVINGDLVVTDSVTLTVQSGALLRMEAGSSLQVNGRLQTSGTVDAHNLTINGLLALSGNGVMNAEGIVNNYGTISHTQTSVPGGSGTDFAFITNRAGSQMKYYGVTITPTSADDMGTTTVVVRGNQPACNIGDNLIHRCFDITPSNPLEATIRFWYLLSERNGYDETAMRAFHWNGNAWDSLIDADGELRGTLGNDAWLEVDGINSYSPFGLASTIPTAITLDLIDVTSGNKLNGVMFIVGVILASFATIVVGFYYKKSAKN